MALKWTADELRAAMSTCTTQIDETGDPSPYCATHQVFLHPEGTCPVVWAVLDALAPVVAKRL